MDPSFYRELECNLSAPYIKGLKKLYAPRLEAETVYATTYENLPGADGTFSSGEDGNGQVFTLRPSLGNNNVCALIQYHSSTATSSGWFRGFIRGVSGQLTVYSLDNVPISNSHRVTMNADDSVSIDFGVPILYFKWVVTVYKTL
jgi:hypothetical protein